MLILLAVGVQTYVHAQEDPYPPALIKRLNIQRIDGYLKMNPSTNDSTLITSEHFYPTGKRQRIDIYDSLGIKDSYRYTYLHDTLMETQTYFRRDTSVYETTFTYNALGKQPKWVSHYNIPGRDDIESESTYDKKGRIIEDKIVTQKGKITRHEKYKYHSNGVMKEKKVLLPEYMEEVFEYDKNGKHLRNTRSKTYFLTETFENHAGSGRKMTRETVSYMYPKRMVALNSWMVLKPRSVMVTECYYRLDGLPEYEIQYLNDKFYAKKVYAYHR
jgi:hypothetical protein